ncbi:MAG: hypothetical protein ABR875_00625 [Minisyncoccia bacterium]|jgi:hypothetical protein
MTKKAQTKFNVIFCFLALVLLSFPFLTKAAVENLDEAMLRKSRYPGPPWNGSNTVFSGENPSNNYFQQPETLIWTDIATGSEVERLFFRPQGADIISNDIAAHRFWNFDGSKVGWFDYGNKRTSTDPERDTASYGRWIANSDGTDMRKSTGWGNTVDNMGIGWAVDGPYYWVGGEIGSGNSDQIFKVSVDPTTNRASPGPHISGAPFFDFNDGRTKWISGSIPSGGTTLLVTDAAVFNYPTPNQIASKGAHFIDFSSGAPVLAASWGIARHLGPSGYGTLVQGNGDGKIYEATQDHLADPAKRPPTGADWTNYWQEITNTFPYGAVMPWIGDQIINGTMEADANWASVGSPAVNERSSTKAHGGTYARHVVDSTPSNGGISQGIDMTQYGYLFTAWYYLASGTLKVNILDGGQTTVSSNTYSTTGSWQKIQFNIYLMAGHYGAVQFINNSNSQPAEFYIDDVSLIPSYTSAPYSDPVGEHLSQNEASVHASSMNVTNPDGQYVTLNYAGGAVHVMLKKSGGASDGGPLWADWNGTSWGGIDQVVFTDDNWSAKFFPHNPYNNPYFGHGSQDQWGTYIIEDMYDYTPKYGDGPGLGIVTTGTKTNPVSPGDIVPWVKADPTHYGMFPLFWHGSANHTSWTGWSDWVVGLPGSPLQTTMWVNKYYATSQPGKTNYLAPKQLINTHLSGSPTYYYAYPRPCQSPDGTKVAFASTLFHAPYAGSVAEDTKYVSMAQVVVENPYPPEIFRVTAASGTVTVRADWGTNSGTWRGYTKRKWPDETTGTYLPPREINKWRLWRSTDGITWTSVNTVTANAWDRYNFDTGTWTGNTYWDATDAPGNGTFYYGLTSMEASGLEGHKLSNIYRITLSGGSGTGSQTASYPADPGGSSPFSAVAPLSPPSLTKAYEKAPATAAGQYTLNWLEPANASAVRYYNIYALDGAAPTAVQQRRIASIPRNICSGGSCSWVDWLGATDGTTRYGITSVDVLGKESQTISLDVSGDTTPPATPTGVVVN